VHRNKTALLTVCGTAIFCLGFLFASVHGADNSAPAVVPTSSAAAPLHITDAQNRLSLGKLNPKGEAKAQANALYAEAMLSLENPKNNAQTSLAQLRQVASLDPHFADAQVEIANILLQLGQIAPALDQLQTAFATNPHSVDIQAALAYVQRLRGNDEEAIKLARNALTKDPTQSTAMRVLLEAASEQNDLPGGVLHIEDILKSSATSPALAWLTLAKLYVEIAHASSHPPTGESLSHTILPIYKQAASKPPSEVSTLILLADTYRDLGRKSEALKTLESAVALDPTNVDIIVQCAELEAELGQNATAIRHYEEAYALTPTLTNLREPLGKLYLENARFDDAIKLFQSGLDENPKDINLTINLSIALEKANHPEQAEAILQKVFSATTCPPEAYLQLAAVQWVQQDFTKSGATLDAAQKRFPSSAWVRFYQAVQHRYEKNYTAAIACLDQVRTLATGADAGVLNANYYVECAMTMDLAGQNDRLETTVREGLSKFPNNATLMNELAFAWADSNTRLTEADALSKRAVDLEPDNGAIQDTRGWVLFQMDKAKDALPYLQRAAILTNNDPVVLQHLGDTYLKLGLRSEAIAAWRRGLEKAPRNGDLANRIDAALAQAKNAHERSAPHH